MSILKPDVGLLCKLGSIAVHLEEYAGNSGVETDLFAALAIIDDPQIQKWLKDMSALAMVPMKR